MLCQFGKRYIGKWLHCNNLEYVERSPLPPQFPIEMDDEHETSHLERPTAIKPHEQEIAPLEKVYINGLHC